MFRNTFPFYRYSYFFWSIYVRVFPIVLIVKENTPQATYRKNMPQSRSSGVYGEMSPYPTVIIVVTAQ